MEIRQLRYFVAVVESGSLSRASTILHVVQSALSQQMMQLEEELGAPLLLRSVRGVQVTEAGSTFYRHAQAILKQIDNAKASIHGTPESIKGPVSIGIPTSTGLTTAPSILACVRRDLPAVQLTIVEGPSGQLAQMLAGGGLDFSFLYHTNFLHGFDTETLLSEPLCLLAAPGTVVDANDPQGALVTLENLARIPLILPRRPNATRLLLEEACKLRGLQLDIVAEADSLDTLGASVDASMGSTVLTAANIAKLKGATGPVRDVYRVEPRLERELVLARSRDYPRTLAADAVYALARETTVSVLRAGALIGGSLRTGSGVQISATRQT